MIKFIKLSKVQRDSRFSLDEIWINPDSILQIRSDPTMKSNLVKGRLPKDLDAQLEFSCVQFGSGNNVSAVTVVGSPSILAEKIFSTNKELLKG